MFKFWVAAVFLVMGASLAWGKGHFVNDPMFSEAMAKSKRVLDRNFSMQGVNQEEWQARHKQASDDKLDQVDACCQQWLKGFKDALKRDKYLAPKDDEDAVAVSFDLLGLKSGPVTPKLKPTAMAERGLVMRVSGDLGGKPAFSYVITFIIQTMQEVDEVAYQAGYAARPARRFLSKGDGLDLRQGGDVDETAKGEE